MSKLFKIHSPFKPAGDQPTAIKQLVEGLADGEVHQTLLGVTGSEIKVKNKGDATL